MFKIGQKVETKFSPQVMEVIDLKTQFVETVITQWEDADGRVQIVLFSINDALSCLPFRFIREKLPSSFLQ